jgi:plastocyanin
MPCRRALLLPIAATVLVLCGGCGDSEPATVVSGGRVAVALDDFRFEPQAIRARSGSISFALRNRGRLAHTFRLRIEGRPVVEVPSLLPGASTIQAARLPRGSYRMFCALANHEELGMYGTLTVR